MMIAQSDIVAWTEAESIDEPTGFLRSLSALHERAQHADGAALTAWHREDSPMKGEAMARYLLRVYRGPTYYPDKQVGSQSLGRLERRAQQLEREGYRVKLLTITGTEPSSHSAKRS